jgi:hypothetical protein
MASCSTYRLSSSTFQVSHVVLAQEHYLVIGNAYSSGKERNALPASEFSHPLMTYLKTLSQCLNEYAFLYPCRGS